MELLRLEDERWRELESLLSRLTPEQMVEPGVTPEWSVKDLLAHLACWMAENVVWLEQMRFGTFDEEQELDVDALNREFYEAWKDIDMQTVMVELESSRTRMLQEWAWLPEITEIAEFKFRSNGPDHIAEHLPDLRRYVEAVAVPR
jgi:hypothetical protein